MQRPDSQFLNYSSRSKPSMRKKMMLRPNKRISANSSRTVG